MNPAKAKSPIPHELIRRHSGLTRRENGLPFRDAGSVRREYLAVGIRAALHLQVDLATEPRWPRINGTFGEDAALAAVLTRASIEGFQSEILGPHSVACMTKHFPSEGRKRKCWTPISNSRMAGSRAA